MSPPDDDRSESEHEKPDSTEGADRDSSGRNDDDDRMNGTDNDPGGTALKRAAAGLTRRRVLQAAGATGTAGVFGLAGWTGRAVYRNGTLDRTGLGTAPSADDRVSGRNSESVPADALLAELQQYSSQRADVGLQATVLFDDGTAWSGVAGNADHGDGVPLSFDAHLYVGSVTKLFTAVLVLHHLERGALSLSATINEWFDLEYADNVTVRMLLNHTSGVPNYTADAWFIARYFGRPGKRWQPRELIDVVRDDPPRFEPGSRHEYSNTNYVLLGLLLERVTGTPYGEQLGELVHEDLGYDRTYYLDYPDDAPIANGYDESIFGIGRRNLTGFRTSLETGAYTAGGVLSTASDVAGFVRSLFTGGVLDERTLDEMLTFVDAPDADVPDQQGYGLGVRRLRVDGQDLVGHTGTIPGYSAIAMHNDEPRYSLTVLANVSTIDQTSICRSLQRVVLDKYD